MSGAQEGGGTCSSHMEDSGRAELCPPDPLTLESNVLPALWYCSLLPSLLTRGHPASKPTESEYPGVGPGVCRCDKHTGVVELLPYTSQLWQRWVQRARLNHQDVSEPRPNPQRGAQGGSKPPPRTAHGSEGLRGCPPRGLPRGHLCSVSVLNQCSSLTPNSGWARSWTQEVDG